MFGFNSLVRITKFIFKNNLFDKQQSISISIKKQEKIVLKTSNSSNRLNWWDKLIKINDHKNIS